MHAQVVQLLKFYKPKNYKHFKLPLIVWKYVKLEKT